VVVPDPVAAQAGEKTPALAVLPADRPDICLDLRIPDALEAFELSDGMPGDRGDHAIPSLVRRLP
jgi:hypothetical protein